MISEYVACKFVHLQECAAADWAVHKRLCKEKARERRVRKSKLASEVD